jgi:hypothetical protein
MSTTSGCPLVQLALSVKYPLPMSGNGAPVFTGDLLPSSRAAYSLDPFALWTAFPPSLVGRDSHDYYGSSATPRRQQRTVRLPRTPNGGSGGHRRDASHVHYQPVGRVGAQLYPGDIAARYRNTPRGLARPSKKRVGKTVPSEQRDRASQQPIAASFGAAVLYRGFKHWFVSYAFLPCYRTRPAGGEPLLDRQGLLPPSASPQASDCPSASPGRYGGRRWVLPSHPVE